MFSIIIPVYNGAGFIDMAINSILAQTCGDWELIIVNDGSVDNTGEVLKKYEDNPKITVHTQKNGGVSVARNNGMALAKNRYLAFLDADDIWLPNHLSVMSELIGMYPDAGLYGAFFEPHLVTGEVISECNYFKNRPQTVYLEDFFKEYAEDKSVKMFGMGSLCVTKSAVDKAGGFPVGCKMGEDLEFMLKIAAYYPVVLTSRVTAEYHKENSVATKDTSFDPDWHFFDVVDELYNSPEISDEKKENIRRVMQWFTIRRSRHYMIEGKRKKAKAALKALGKTELKKDLFITRILLMLPAKLVRKIFLIRWRSQA